MDHFRPKNAIKSADKKCESTTINNTDSYWWLAFDWENYRLSGHLTNSNKNAYFPLRTRSQIATSKEECESEEKLIENHTTEFKAILTDKIENEVVAFLNSKEGGDYKIMRKDAE